MPALTILDVRAARPVARPRWLEVAIAVSALVHALLLAIVIFARRPVPFAPPPAEQPGFEMVFQGGVQSPHAVPVPGRFQQIPKGADVPAPPQPQSQPAVTPPPPPANPAPEVNLLPPEMRMMAPPQERPDQQASQQPAHTERQRTAHTRTAPNASPFSHPREYSLSGRPSQSVPHGLRNSRSLDLSLGLLVQGGMLRDAVPHVASPGADGDYLEQLSEYVETHKYYPEQAAENREDGTAVIRATIARDGTVKNVQLMESSGSRTLDLAWISLFRDKHLVPFPDDMKEAQRDFTLSMDYQLMYR